MQAMLIGMTTAGIVMTSELTKYVAEVRGAAEERRS